MAAGLEAQGIHSREFVKEIGAQAPAHGRGDLSLYAGGKVEAIGVRLSRHAPGPGPTEKYTRTECEGAMLSPTMPGRAIAPEQALLSPRIVDRDDGPARGLVRVPEAGPFLVGREFAVAHAAGF